MRNRGAILGSVMLIVLASMLVGAGTFAYFSDTGTSTLNKFTASNDFDIKLWDEATSTWKDNVKKTWTFDDMIPGDIVTVDLYIKNTGSVDIKALICDLDIDWARTDDEAGIWDLVDYFYMEDDAVIFLDNAWIPITRWGHFHTWFDVWEGRSIRDHAESLDGICPGDDILYWTGMPNDPPKPMMGKGVLHPGEIMRLWYKFSFRETCTDQNDAKGDKLTLTYTVEARTSPCECITTEEELYG